MLKKLLRFHGHNSLNFVYTHGKSVRSNYLQLKYSPNTRRDTNRVAVVVAKKVAKKAPTRNRIRRRVYEHLRAHLPMVKQPYDLVFTVYDERVAEIASTELNKLIVELLTKAKLYKN